MKTKLILITLGLTLVGCAAGSNLNYGEARKIGVGTSESELVSRLGKPYQIISRGDYQVYVWSHANALTGNSGAFSFIVQDGKVLKAPVVPASFD